EKVVPQAADCSQREPEQNEPRRMLAPAKAKKDLDCNQRRGHGRSPRIEGNFDRGRPKQDATATEPGERTARDPSCDPSAKHAAQEMKKDTEKARDSSRNSEHLPKARYDEKN